MADTWDPVDRFRTRRGTITRVNALNAVLAILKPPRTYTFIADSDSNELMALALNPMDGHEETAFRKREPLVTPTFWAERPQVLVPSPSESELYAVVDVIGIPSGYDIGGSRNRQHTDAVGHRRGLAARGLFEDEASRATRRRRSPHSRGDRA